MNDVTPKEESHPVFNFREWTTPGTFVQLLTVVVCLVLAWGTVNSRLDNAESKLTGHELRLVEVEKASEATRMEAERANTQLERRLSEIPAIKVQLQDIDRNIQRLLAQKEVR